MRLQEVKFELHHRYDPYTGEPVCVDAIQLLYGHHVVASLPMKDLKYALDTYDNYTNNSSKES